MKRISRGDAWVLAGGLVSVLMFLAASPVGDVGPLAQFWSDHRTLVHVVRWSAFGLSVAMVLLGRRSRPVRVGLVVLVAACCQVPGLLSPPQSSSDAYRYVLDGRVQLAGISPYRYVPLDDHLARLRDPLLFPGLTPAQRSGVQTPPRLPTDPAAVAALAAPDPRTVINRPGVPTIYPPVAQAWFTGIAAVTPWRAGTLGLQAGAALLAVLITAVLALVLRRRTGDPMLAVLWGWSPTVVLETGGNAHVDIVAAALILAAMLVLNRPGARARVAGGVLLGLAIATKILPVLLLPAVTVLRTRAGGGWRWLQVPVSALTTALASYVPHVLVAGSLVLGYLPAYLTEEGFNGGTQRYALLGLVLPAAARQPVALLLLAGLALAALWQAGVRRPETVAVWLFGGSLLISTPAYPWYCLPLLALAVLARRPEWLAVAIATQWSYMHLHHSGPVGAGYLLALVVVLAATAARSRPRGVIPRAKTAATRAKAAPANQAC